MVLAMGSAPTPSLSVAPSLFNPLKGNLYNTLGSVVLKPLAFTFISLWLLFLSRGGGLLCYKRTSWFFPSLQLDYFPLLCVWFLIFSSWFVVTTIHAYSPGVPAPLRRLTF